MEQFYYSIKMKLAIIYINYELAFAIKSNKMNKIVKK